MNRYYAWIGLKNNSKGIQLTWLFLLKDTKNDADGNPFKGPAFAEDLWSIYFRNTSPENVKSWAGKKPRMIPHYTGDTQELYNHTVGRLCGEPLTIFEEYLNNGHRGLRTLLRKCMNAEQWILMACAAKWDFPSLQYT